MPQFKLFFLKPVAVVHAPVDLALLSRASKQLLQRLEKARRQSPGARRRLRAIVAAIIQFFDEQPHLLNLIQRAEVLRGPDFPWRKTRDAVLRLMIELFEEAEARGEFAIRDPHLAALMLLGGLRSVLRFGKQPRPRDLSQRIVDTFVHGADMGSNGKRPACQQPGPPV